MRYRVPGSDTGSERSMISCMSEKIAVVPPIPIASVNTAVTVKTGE
jgi:hypothetical protein